MGMGVGRMFHYDGEELLRVFPFDVNKFWGIVHHGYMRTVREYY